MTQRNPGETWLEKRGEQPELGWRITHPECDKCVGDPADWMWCVTHDSPMGERSDGWAGCTKAIVADVRAACDEFERRDTAALAALVAEPMDYGFYERAMMDQVEPGLKLSAVLIDSENGFLR